MGEDSVHLPSDLSLEYHIVTLFEKLEGMRYSSPTRIPMQAEIRTLEFWRSLLIECMASFCYVFIVCGAAAGTGVGASVASVLLATSLSSCFTMATLTHCFRHISGKTPFYYLPYRKQVKITMKKIAFSKSLLK